MQNVCKVCGQTFETETERSYCPTCTEYIMSRRRPASNVRRRKSAKPNALTKASSLVCTIFFVIFGISFAAAMISFHFGEVPAAHIISQMDNNLEAFNLNYYFTGWGDNFNELSEIKKAVSEESKYNFFDNHSVISSGLNTFFKNTATNYSCLENTENQWSQIISDLETSFNDIK